MNEERLRRIVFNFGSLSLGFGIIIHQAFILDPAEASAALLGTALALLAGPAGVAGISALRNGGGSTNAQSSSDASPSPPVAPSSPSASSEGNP